MKVDLKKKRALAVAVLLSLSCYGQAWADTLNYADKNIAAGKMETLGAANEKLTIDSSNIHLGQDANLKIQGSEIKMASTTIEGKGIIDISADNINFEIVITSFRDLKINANVVRIKGKDIICNLAKINQDEDYKNAITQIEGSLNINPYKVTDYKFNDFPPGVKINFNGKESYFKGNIVNAIINTDKGQLIDLSFDNGAQWIYSDEENAFAARGLTALDNLNLLNGSIIDFNTNTNNTPASLIVLKTFNGDGGIVKMSFDGSKDNTNQGINTEEDCIVAAEHNGTTTVIFKNLSEDTSYILGKVVAMVAAEKGTFKGGKEEGALSWTNYQLVPKAGDGVLGFGELGKNNNWIYWVIDSYTQEHAPTTSVNTLLSTVTAGYDTWRNDTDKLNERMGELRLNGAGNDGVWVRTKGSEFGRHGGNDSYTNKQQTYQLGYDAVTSKDDKQTTYTGMAAEYSKGSLSFDSGTGTMKSMGMGVYQTKMYESGHYLDLVGRFDKYKNDFHVADTQGNAISGKYGNNALSLSAEYGRKNELKHGWYIEPQSEVTLGYMFGNDFTTSNNIRVEQKNMPALIGRLGLNIGREISDKVNFYVKASVNHDFLSNYDVHMTDLSTGDRLNASDRFGSSWFDYGAGLSVKTGKDSYAYFDIERAVGGEYKKNWDWNAGVRWSF